MKGKSVFGLIAFIINIILCFINLVLFIPMLAEQIAIGKGTNIELAALYVWLIDFLMIIPLVAVIILTIVSILKKDVKWRIICNLSLFGISIILMVLTTLFMII